MILSNLPQKHCSTLNIQGNQTLQYSHADLQIQKLVGERSLCSEEAAAEGTSRRIPGLTQLCFQRYFSYMQDILKHFHRVPLRDKEHYCAYSPDREM